MVLVQRQQVNQWNKIEDPEINSHIYGQLIFDKEAKKYSGKQNPASINSAGLTGGLYVEE